MSSLPTPNRRQVLCGLAVALVAPGALAACSGGAGEYEGAGETTAAPPPTDGTPLSQIPVGGGTVVTGATGPVLLVQPTAGTVKAYDAKCPHQGTAVNPPIDGVIICPNHKSAFNADTGAVTKGPANRGLTELPTRIVGGNVQV